MSGPARDEQGQRVEFLRGADGKIRYGLAASVQILGEGDVEVFDPLAGPLYFDLQSVYENALAGGNDKRAARKMLEDYASTIPEREAVEECWLDGKPILILIMTGVIACSALIFVRLPERPPGDLAKLSLAMRVERRKRESGHGHEH